MIQKLVGLVAAFGLLAACEAGEAALSERDGGALAPGLDASGQDVDPMLVGQRLMAAGEHELALKAFLRAAGDQGFTAPVLASIGTANIGLGRLGQAEAILRRSIAVDETYVPGWNNLGVVLMEKGELGEAERVFRTAFALDNGASEQIRENLRLALAKLENPGYDVENNNNFALVRRGSGEYQLLSTP